MEPILIDIGYQEKETHHDMYCCEQRLLPAVHRQGVDIFVTWTCPVCGQVAQQDIGTIDLTLGTIYRELTL